VQTGNGRCGSLFAYQQLGVTPDVLTTAKGLGGGFPIGAMLTTAKIAETLAFGTHGSTYGGNPLGCAVAEAVLDEVTSADIAANIKARSQQLREGLTALAKKFGVFDGVRGMGLLLGAPMSAAWKGRAKDVVNAALRQGLWVLIAGPDVLRLAPPLNLSEADAAEGLRRLEHALAELTALPKVSNG
jgi:acetylornithine/succinyldiaminopimelate/putrescine aminotransferase